MKEIKDFEGIIKELGLIGENPNFSDDMRNKSTELCYYIKDACKPLESIRMTISDLNALSSFYFNKRMTKEDFERVYCRKVEIIN